jgi:hypothetical protein
MNNNFIPLNSPITKQKTIVYNKMTIQILNHMLGNNECEIEVNVYDDTCEYKKIFTYLMSGTDYLNWTTDNYLMNWISLKLRSEIF